MRAPVSVDHRGRQDLANLREHLALEQTGRDRTTADVQREVFGSTAKLRA